MRTNDNSIIAFLKQLMRQRGRLPSQLAVDLGVSHVTMLRWLAGKDIPSTKSCHKLAEYSGAPIQELLSITGHLPKMLEQVPAEWPAFREYAQKKYPEEIDEDIITMIEHLIEYRRKQKRGKGKLKYGEGKSS